MDRLLEATLNVVKNRGEYLFLDVSRPYAYTLVARVDKTKYIVKVAADSEEVSQSAIKDLKLLGTYTDASAVCLVSNVKGQILQRGVVHIRDGITFMSLSTFADLLDGKQPFFRLSRGIITASIDGEKLKERRQKAAMSLGTLALNLGVSRETVYRYERGEIEAPMRIAQRLMALFGEDIVKPIDVNEKPKTRPEELASRMIQPHVYRLVESHPDAVTREKKPIFISSDRERYAKTVELAQALDAEVEGR
ncbi:helix-turn-helix domain-containing protein [Pyrobaculum sp.]|uniref:helix-turn-helix domain-containing protein n=1 Tax=Pyrobaculum sp. TaxID=2004705 RepID=UPI00315E28B5